MHGSDVPQCHPGVSFGAEDFYHPASAYLSDSTTAICSPVPSWCVIWCSGLLSSCHCLPLRFNHCHLFPSAILVCHLVLRTSIILPVPTSLIQPLPFLLSIFWRLWKPLTHSTAGFFGCCFCQNDFYGTMLLALCPPSPPPDQEDPGIAFCQTSTLWPVQLGGVLLGEKAHAATAIVVLRACELPEHEVAIL